MSIKRFIYILLWMAFVTPVHAQQDKIDSLKSELIHAKPEDSALILMQISSYLEQNQTDSALSILIQAVEISKRIGKLKLTARSYAAMGKIYFRKGNNLESSNYYTKALDLYKKVGDEKELAEAYYNLGNTYYNLGNYNNASENYIASLKISEKIKDSTGIAKSYSSIAFFYNKTKDFTNALKYHEKALDIFTATNNAEGIAFATNNIGNIYLLLDDLDKAEEYYQRSLKMKQESNMSQRSILITLHNLGEVYMGVSKPVKALEYYNKSLQIGQEIGDIFSSAYIHYNISLVYDKLKNHDRLLYHLEKALTLAKQSNATELILKINDKYSEYYEETGNYKLAYEFLKQNYIAKDTILPEEFKTKVAQYEVSKVETENMLLKKESEIQALKSIKQKNQNNFLIAFSILIIVLIIVLYSRYLLKKRTNNLLELKNSELELANTTKDKFFAIVSHDLKNQLTAFQNISSVLAENFSSIAEEKKHHLILRINTAANTLYGVLENLLTWSSAQLKGVEFNPSDIHVKSLCERTIDELKLNAEKKRIKVNCEIPEQLTVFTDENMLKTVIRNLCNNAIKFSHEDSGIRLTGEVQDARLTFSVIDQGIGLNKDDLQKLFRIDVNHKEIGSGKDKGAGLGLVITKEFVERMEGEIKIKSEPGKGSTFSFSLPLNK
ncbi:tetratricopeptide repeat protein [Bacteroidota bacterium]